MNLITKVAEDLKAAAAAGVNDDTDASLEYIRRCTLDIRADAHKGMRLMYTRSTFNELLFLHLSLSFRRPPYTEPADFDHRLAKRVAPVFFAPHAADVVVCPPETAQGKHWRNWHFRLFTDSSWKPNGYRPLCKPGDAPLWTWAEYLRAQFA